MDAPVDHDQTVSAAEPIVEPDAEPEAAPTAETAVEPPIEDVVEVDAPVPDHDAAGGDELPADAPTFAPADDSGH